MGKYSEALGIYERLKKADPALATQLAYLDAGQGDGTRAAEADKRKGYVLWQD